MQNMQGQFMRTLSVKVDRQFQNKDGLNTTWLSPRNANATKKEARSGDLVPQWSYDYPVVAYTKSDKLISFVDVSQQRHCKEWCLNLQNYTFERFIDHQININQTFFDKDLEHESHIMMLASYCGDAINGGEKSFVILVVTVDVFNIDISSEVKKPTEPRVTVL